MKRIHIKKHYVNLENVCAIQVSEFGNVKILLDSDWFLSFESKEFNFLWEWLTDYDREALINKYLNGLLSPTD